MLNGIYVRSYPASFQYSFNPLLHTSFLIHFQHSCPTHESSWSIDSSTLIASLFQPWDLFTDKGCDNYQGASIRFIIADSKLNLVKVIPKELPADYLSFFVTSMMSVTLQKRFNTLRPRQNGSHFPDDIFKWIFLNENVWILIKISLKFVPKRLINNIPALVQIMAWHRPGDKPLSEPMMVSLPTHICVTRPQWVNIGFYLNMQDPSLQPNFMAAIQNKELCFYFKHSSFIMN